MNNNPDFIYAKELFEKHTDWKWVFFDKIFNAMEEYRAAGNTVKYPSEREIMEFFLEEFKNEPADSSGACHPADKVMAASKIVELIKKMNS